MGAKPMALKYFRAMDKLHGPFLLGRKMEGAMNENSMINKGGRKQ